MFNSLRSCAVMAALACTASLAAASSYDFSFAVGTGPTAATGSGNFLVDDSTGMVTGITGSYSDSIVTGAFDGVVALGTDSGFNYDNLYLPTGDHFDNGGLLVDVNGEHVNFYDDNGTFAVVDYIPGTSNYVNVDAGPDQSLTVSAVPEPENVALLLAGLGLVGVTARRKQASI